MGSLAESHERVRASWSELVARWAEARGQWRDSVAVRFEREWWRELEEIVPRVLEAMAEADEVLARGLSDTEED
ncbi:MAG TPA: hypothetical protein VJ866_09290 [Pyrinomonadaceae bacterium]|nr:hypothetical protein [Pyrinomonadaceae bacterium]